MNVFKKKIKEWVYSISTEDHYAEYNSDEEQPSFNMGMRSGQGNVNPSSMNLADNMSSADISGRNNNNGAMASGDNFQIDDFGTGDASQKGVSEVMLAWRHIDAWTDKYNPDLNATLSDPCTQNDITHAEEDLEVSLPPSVKASLRIHDGQEDLESMTGTSGLIYGYQLMTLDQIVAMTQTWRNVAKNLEKHRAAAANAAANGLSNQSSTGSSAQQQQGADDNIQQNQFKLPYIPTQSSIPPETIQAAYAHPAWIPLVTDNAGNHIGVDLAPGPNGTYGQVIMFGREFDVKFAVADNWGEFLLSFANDLEIGNWYLIDDSDDYFAGEGELVFRDKKTNGRVQEYMEVLKKRTTQKYNQSIAAQQQQPEERVEQQVKTADVTTTSQPIDDGNDTDFDIDDESIEAANVAPVVEQKQAVVEPVVVEAKEEPIATSEPKKEQAAVDDVAVEEAPVDDAAVEEAPVEETPVEEAPVEEAPVEDKSEQAEVQKDVTEPELSSQKVNEEVKELQTEFENVAL